MEMKKDLEKLTYTELEKESEAVLAELSKADLPLDEAGKVYDYGKKVADAMEKKLAELSKSVSDTVER
jgi:exonuclease VII small subunit